MGRREAEEKDTSSYSRHWGFQTRVITEVSRNGTLAQWQWRGDTPAGCHPHYHHCYFPNPMNEHFRFSWCHPAITEPFVIFLSYRMSACGEGLMFHLERRWESVVFPLGVVQLGAALSILSWLTGKKAWWNWEVEDETEFDKTEANCFKMITKYSLDIFIDKGNSVTVIHFM